jgi:hypothetical protein
VLRALRKRDIKQASTLAAVAKVARENPARDVRYEAALALLAWRRSWPEASSVLRESVAHDEDERVRSVAAQATL